MFLFNFLDKEEILKGKNYEIFDFLTLIGILILIYFFSGIINLYPIYIIKQTPYYDDKNSVL